jgi:hypothetical protein
MLKEALRHSGVCSCFTEHQPKKMRYGIDVQLFRPKMEATGLRYKSVDVYKYTE